MSAPSHQQPLAPSPPPHVRCRHVSFWPCHAHIAGPSVVVPVTPPPWVCDYITSLHILCEPPMPQNKAKLIMSPQTGHESATPSLGSHGV